MKIKNVIVVALSVLALAACEMPEDGTAADRAGVNSKRAEKSDSKAKESAPKEASAPQESAGQANAREAAETYLDMTPFSRSGLIEQLEFEGYSTKDATYGVDAQKANWNEQAAAAAENYLDMTAFSRSGLIEQLEFEGYTTEQATFGVNKVGL